MKKIVVVTGCLGLVGYEACLFFSKKSFKVIGIDNNLRKYFFGKEGSNQFKLNNLKKKLSIFIFSIMTLDHIKN